MKTLSEVKCYPEDISNDKGKKGNFRNSCKNFKIVDGHLTYKGKWRVIFENDGERITIDDVHEGLGDDLKAKVLATYRGHETI